MNQKEILEGNKLIAEFMGFKRKEDLQGFATFKNWTIEPFGYFNDEGLKYHSYWDWLMPVVEKVRDSNCMISIRFNRQLNTANTTIACFENKWHKDISISGVGIESTYKAVVGFIEWHNSLLPLPKDFVEMKNIKFK